MSRGLEGVVAGKWGDVGLSPTPRSMSEEEIREKKRGERRIREEQERDYEGYQKRNCYEAELNHSNKFSCPECHAVEGGTRRIINHRYSCPNRGREFCQKYNNQGGGRRNRRVTKKARKNRSRLSRRK